MKIYLCSFLSRLALPGLMSLMLLSSALTRADTITTFLVSGTAENISGGTLNSCANLATCPFYGMFQVDVTIGMVESSSLDITFPGLAAFDNLTLSTSMGTDWNLSAVNSPGDLLALVFTPAPHPASLRDLTGGSIVGAFVRSNYNILSGSITPVPEPSLLVLLAGGIGLLFGLTRRRFAKKSAIH
jgi:hypothetical protein